MAKKTTALNLPEEELVHPGSRACSGCGLGIAYRVGLKALGKDTILVVPPSCLTVLQGLYPIASTKMPCINVTFASTAAAASGVLAALRAQGKKDIKVAGWAGDGGTSDIGIQALSGAIERGEDFIYICYDNEGYMNTGVQRSGTTPIGAITTNTPLLGKLQPKKDMLAIMAAHGIAYVAATSAAYPLDLYDKIRKAQTFPGTKYIHLFPPCPTGWGFTPTRAVKVRFRKMSNETIARMQQNINERWHEYRTSV
jgi:pyruvate ferredoxin oxidoreductase beta subunit